MKSPYPDRSSPRLVRDRILGAINPITGIIFGGVIAAVLLFVAYSIYTESVKRHQSHDLRTFPFALRRAVDRARV